ncbi:MAG: carboxylating nicotinate-nucleotide diphosphorylase [Bdellovibrionales bacterium]|nr:carboxylating nicotinate-nucleotide diphosphorylase [Bdellovibrionales bacterium]
MPDGDITTDGLNLSNKIGRAKVVAKEDLVISGTEAFNSTFTQVDPSITINWQFKNSDFVFKGQTICLLLGPLPSLLKAERVALNFLGRLSGIATLTRCYVNQAKNHKTKILDTRKTTPNLRALEKKAVVDGGGMNHRMSLSDRILIKENHIRAAGGIKKSIATLRDLGHKNIEIEVRNLAEAQEAIEGNADRLLLDNMSLEEMTAVLKITPASMQTEASGNMTLERISQVAEVGVDFISVGAITHSAPCADVSLLFE